MKPTMANLRRLVKAAGGRVEGDGVGGWEVLAPEGRMWTEAEVWCQPLPLNEYDDPAERVELIEYAIKMVQEGHKPHPDW